MRLAPADIAATAAFFDQLEDEQVENLAAGLFGIYTDAGSAAATQDNVRSLWPEIWEYLPYGSRYGFGTRYGRFLANADQDKGVLARELLDLVEGAAYFPEPVRVAELDGALDDLLTAHHGFNNFYNEPPLARRLAELVGDKGDIPAPLRGKYVHTLVEVFLTNGSGVAFNADPVYRSLLQELDSGLAAVALRSFTDPVIGNRLQFSLPAHQWPNMLELIASKLTGRSDRELLAAVQTFTGPLDQLRADSALKRILDPAAARAEAPTRRGPLMSRGTTPGGASAVGRPMAWRAAVWLAGASSTVKLPGRVLKCIDKSCSPRIAAVIRHGQVHGGEPARNYS